MLLNEVSSNKAKNHFFRSGMMLVIMRCIIRLYCWCNKYACVFRTEFATNIISLTPVSNHYITGLTHSENFLPTEIILKNCCKSILLTTCSDRFEFRIVHDSGKNLQEAFILKLQFSHLLTTFFIRNPHKCSGSRWNSIRIDEIHCTSLLPLFSLNLFTLKIDYLHFHRRSPFS